MSASKLALYPTLTDFKHLPPVLRLRWMPKVKTSLDGTMNKAHAHTQVFLQVIRCSMLATGK